MADKKQQPTPSEMKKKRKEIKKVYSELKKIVPSLQSDEFADSGTIICETAKYVGQLRWAEAKALREYRVLYERTEFLKAVVAEVSERVGASQTVEPRSIRNPSSK